jgi:fucose permease
VNARGERVSIAVMFFVNGTLFSTWVSRIPDVRESLGLSEARLGVALLSMGVGTIFALPLTSTLIARYGSHRVVAPSALACCIAVPLAGRAPTFLALVAALTAFGAAMGAMDVSMNAQASLRERKAARSIMSSFHGLWSLGGLVGASLGGVIATLAWRPHVHFLAVCAGLALVVLAARPALLRDGPAAEGTSPLAWPSRAVLAIGLVGACGSVVEGGIADWSGVYLRDALGATAGLAAGGYAAFSVAMMAGRFTGDRLIDRFGRRALLRLGSAVTAIAVATALIVGDAHVAVGAFLFAGLGMSTVFPIAFSAAGGLRGTTPGQAIAGVATMAYGGGLVGPPFIGFAATATSLPMALGLLVVMCVVIALLTGKAIPNAVER